MSIKKACILLLLNITGDNQNNVADIQVLKTPLKDLPRNIEKYEPILASEAVVSAFGFKPAHYPRTR